MIPSYAELVRCSRRELDRWSPVGHAFHRAGKLDLAAGDLPFEHHLHLVPAEVPHHHKGNVVPAALSVGDLDGAAAAAIHRAREFAAVNLEYKGGFRCIAVPSRNPLSPFPRDVGSRSVA